MIRFARYLVAGTLATLAEAIMPAPVRVPPDVVPPVADGAEFFLRSLRWHHGRDGRCDYADCYPCWLRTHETDA